LESYQTGWLGHGFSQVQESYHKVKPQTAFQVLLKLTSLLLVASNRARGANGKNIVLVTVGKKDKNPGRIRLQVIPDWFVDVLEHGATTYVSHGST
jgi:hypothetical protein